GDLSGATASLGYTAVGMMILLLTGSLFTGDTLNALALGDEEAGSLGINVARARMVAYLVASLVVGVSTAFCGAIGFVGLVVPHILRRIVGADHRILLPLSVV